MTVCEVIAEFLNVCPSIAPAWQEHLTFWEGEEDRGFYNDVSVIAHHLVDCFEQGRHNEFPTVFALMERFLSEGDKAVRDLIMIGLIEDIQNIASHKSFGPEVFVSWLGAMSQRVWDEVNSWWDQLEEAKPLDW